MSLCSAKRLVSHMTPGWMTHYAFLLVILFCLYEMFSEMAFSSLLFWKTALPHRNSETGLEERCREVTACVPLPYSCTSCCVDLVLFWYTFTHFCFYFILTGYNLFWVLVKILLWVIHWEEILFGWPELIWTLSRQILDLPFDLLMLLLLLLCLLVLALNLE